MITYGEYKRLGYSDVPKAQFKRFADISAKAADIFLNGGFDYSDDGGRRCLCEICDIYYSEGCADKKIAGFTNDGYREQYFESADVNMRVYDLVRLYFPRDKLFRGV